jgi:GT2 family glycosyltransferase
VKASVLLPFRDVSRWLDEAIRSVREEACVGRIVLVDDGSTDASSEIAARHAHEDARVEIVRTAGLGIVRALEIGRTRCQSEYIARMDGDDVSLRGRIERQIEALDRDQTLAVLGTQVEAFPSPDEGLTRYVDWQNALLSPIDHAHALFIESPLCHPSVTMRASAVETVGGYREGDFPEDYDLWLRLAAQGFSLAKVDAHLFRWRHRESRLTFTDARCSRAAFRRLKARHLAARLIHEGGFAIWGAGTTGRRLAGALREHGAWPSAFIDIDPRKIGNTKLGGAQVHAPTLLDSLPRPFIVVAVGARGAREVIRPQLHARGLVEGRDFLCAS